MKRQKTQFIIMLLLLIAVIAGVWGVRYYNTYNAEKENAESEPAYTVLDLNESDVAAFTFTNENESYTFEKTDDGGEETKWQCTEALDLSIDSAKISSLLDNVIFVQADACIENVDDLEQYGLSASDVTVELMLNNGENHKLLFGDYNEITSQYYISLEGENSVYILASDLKSNFLITPEDMAVDES